MLPVVGSIVWFLVKVFQFQTSPEQYADGMVILQISRGWLEGRPFLFDTIYGHHAQQHNYYFIPLVGLFTKPMGVYGLFLAYLALVALFFWKWYRSFSRFDPFQRSTTWLTAVFFVFGPMGYFIYLDYFGWHPEHYLIPLLALLAISLAERKKGMIIFWLLLTFSVKESSIVLICCLLLFCSVVDLILQDPAKRWSDYLFNQRNRIIIGVCMALFAAGLGWLSHLNGPQPSRLAQAFANAQPGRTLFFYILFTCSVGSLTFGIGLLPFIPWLRNSPHKSLILCTLAGGYALLLVMFATEALFYFPTIYPGVAYPPRIGGLWGFLLSAFIFLSYRLTLSGIVPDHRATSWILTGCLVQFLLSPFLVAHFFTLGSRPSVLSAHISYLAQTRFGLYPYPDGIPRQLYQLAKKLPTGSEVIVPFRHMRYFENVYPGFWEEDGLRPKHILGKPLLYVYDKELVDKGAYHTFPGKDYVTLPNEHLLILADSSWYNLNFK